MTLRATATGMLTANPQIRASGNGTYITAPMAAPTSKDSGAQLSLVSFRSEVVEALKDLHKGDCLSVEGSLKEYESRVKGVIRYLWDLKVDKVLAVNAARTAQEVTS